MRYLSVCSGIEAATAAWHSLGWEPFAFSEIEKFPSQVLAHRYPDVPNLGDMTKFKEWPDAAIDVLVGGTPCQSFSVAGLRKGLDDPRGNLMLTYLAIADKYRPEWLVWENVPGVLSSNGGRDFASLLRGMGELGYGFAYRVLDAQYFGVAQRRRRVFVIGCLGSWQCAAAVLFERYSLQGHPAPSRQAGQEITPTIRAGAANGGKGHGARSGDSKDELIVPIAGALSLRGEGFDASEDGTGRGTPLVPVSVSLRGRDGGATAELGDEVGNCLRSSGGGGDKAHVLAPIAYGIRTANTSSNGLGIQEEATHTLDRAMGVAVAFSENIRGEVVENAISRTLQTSGGKPGQGYVAARIGMQVRRLTPRECERLQGFEDDYTLIPGKPMKHVDPAKLDMDYLKYLERGGSLTFQQCINAAADGPRYKALGNSMARPCMLWLGRRIQAVSRIKRERAAA